MSVLLASGGVFISTKHGDPTTGVQRLASEPRGECSQCHDEHASRDGVSNGGPFPYALFGPDDNTLCFTCHNVSGALAVYQGSAAYGRSSHAQSSAMVWPGPVPPSRPNSDSGKCVNCHDPHGTGDGAGLIPGLAALRDEALCLPCHDGSVGRADIRTQLSKTFRHPVEVSGRHDESEGGSPARFGGGNRHAECVDCHNPHAAAADRALPEAPAVSGRLLGVSRVRVTNGAAGMQPTYQWVGPGDSTPAMEYEVCFKCHSSWTTQPLGQSDLGLLLNDNNPSFHPVEKAGKNPNIAPASFVLGWNAGRLTYCSDCHGSDDARVAGPHGSNNRYLLKLPYSTGSGSLGTAPTDLCFACHAYDVYANRNASDAVQSASRFNRPRTSQGHAFHVGEQLLSCYTCHQTHGSTQSPALIASGRSPGILSYSQAFAGGTCTATCHGSQSYIVNYAR